MIRLTTVLLTSCLVALPAIAADTMGDTDNQDQGNKGYMETKTFSELDSDNSGTLNQSEASAGGVRNFSDADEDGDGELNRNEYYQAITKR